MTGEGPNSVRFWWLAGLAVSAALVAVSVYERSLVLDACCGEFVYPIDDTYIHIAMAKCLACHGTWGVEPGKMAFCSSSPLWTLLLGGLYALFGVSEALPWYLALGFGVGTAFVVCRLFAALRCGAVCQVGASAFVAVAGPAVCTVALGMEHAMHAFFIVSSLAASVGMMRGSRLCAVVAPLVAAAATASRYESLFLLLPVGCVLCGFEIHDRWRRHGRVVPTAGLLFVVGAGLPVVVYGVWALCCGGHFFPNSLLLKGGFMSPSALFEKAVMVFGTPRPGSGFLYLLVVALALVAVLPRTALVWRLLGVSVVIAIGGQMLLADIGQLCRYEAYLTSAGALVVVAAIADAERGTRREACVAAGLLSAVVLVYSGRAVRSFGELVHASDDIRCQQVLMTRIMSGLPEESRGCVALNDLGYMALHGGFPILDIWGLGSQDATELVLENGKRSTRESNEVLFRRHKVRYAVVFEKWFPAFVMPEGSIDVATMTLADNWTCGSDTVVFRATSEEDADRLERHLEKCADALPGRVSLRFVR